MRSHFGLIITILFITISCSRSDIEVSKKIVMPAEDHFWQRNFPETSFDHKHYISSIISESQSITKRNTLGSWVDQGPANLGGRVNCMAIQPDNANIIYIGYGRGGLFKTIDGGKNWDSIFDEFTFLSISHIVIDPNDYNTIYIGTGDENISGYPEIGNGVYKSVDGGNSWTHLGLSDPSIISSIQVSNSDKNIVYASAMGIPFEKSNDRGLYKSVDGGSQWEQILFVNDSTGIIDMVIDPSNHDIIYAAGWNRIRNNYESKISGPDAKIWKSIDGGKNWDILENGLPTGNLTRIGLAIWDGDPNILFASYSSSSQAPGCDIPGNHLLGIYKTTDAGSSWAAIPTREDVNGLPCMLQGGFAWYFGQIRVNPTNVDDISILGVYHYRTTDGGTSWSNAAPMSNVHVDYHELIYKDDIMYVGTDGGAYKSNESNEWIDIENISTNQFYRVGYNPHRPDIYYGGLQDNGSASGNGDEKNNWARIYGGDGFQFVFDSSDPNVFFAESQRGGIVKINNDDFENFTEGLNNNRNWDMQYFMSPIENNILYTATDVVYRRHATDDNEWQAISDNITDTDANSPYYSHNASTICQSSIVKEYLYVGTSDGKVHRQETSGEWTDITNGLIRRYVTDIKASPSVAERVFVTLSGYKNNDNTPLVYRSEDRGDTWESIMGNLPPIAINDIYILPGYDDQLLIIANEAGVYITKNGGVEWERMGDNMPYIPVYDIEYNPILNQIVVGTFGRGLQTFDLDQIDLNSTVSAQNPIDEQINLYPTISNGIYNISNPQNTDLTLDVYDLNGQKILQITSPTTTMDLQNFPNGMYWIAVRYSDKFEIKKIIKR